MAVFYTLCNRYLEDLSTFYHPETKYWMKTLQGLAILIQCFGGEVPSFFLSGKTISGLIQARIKDQLDSGTPYFSFLTLKKCRYH